MKSPGPARLLAVGLSGAALMSRVAWFCAGPRGIVRRLAHWNQTAICVAWSSHIRLALPAGALQQVDIDGMSLLWSTTKRNWTGSYGLIILLPIISGQLS
jgi:hypothetical protein